MDENWDLWKLESKLEHRRVWLLLSLAIGFLMSTLGCTVERRKTDAELGLTPQQAAGRRVYDERCDRCHEPYSTRGKKGPSLKGIFKRPYMPESGLPANDERATDIIRYGRSKMPGFSEVLTQEQIDDLLAYMHTL
jgi:mono/diheme cytochrome c family protein